MFCIYCGKEIAEGEVCNCKSQAATSENQQPTYDSFNYNGDQNYKKPYSNKYDAIVRVLGSPIFLAFSILYSLGFALPFVNGWNFNFLGILLIIATWITYASARKYMSSNTDVTTSGFTITSGVIIAGIVIASVTFAATVVALIVSIIASSVSSIDFTNYKYFTISNNGLIVVSSILLVVSVCVYLFILFFLIKLRHSITYVRSVLRNEEPAKKMTMFAPIMLFICAFFTVSGAISNFCMEPVVDKVIHDINIMLREFCIDYDLNLHTLSYTYRINYFGVVGSMITAAAMIIGGIVLIRLKKSVEEQN